MATEANEVNKLEQLFILFSKKDFNPKLVEAFIAATVPVYQLQNLKIRKLFTDLGQPVPPETNCREQADKLAADNVALLKQRLCGEYAFLVVDESEVGGCKYFNILIGNTSAPEKNLYFALQGCRENKSTCYYLKD